ncbi:MAG: iron chelate uptake ABC transporter family permease subunit [Planctomycetota bacterium]
MAQTDPSLLETMTFRAGYNTSLVVAGTSLLGFAAGVVGVFALLRKRALVADALSHATLPGIAAAFLAASWLGNDGKPLPMLLGGAIVTGVMGIVCIQFMLRHTRLNEDAAIGIVLSVFFGLGIVGLSFIQANQPAGSAGLKAFLYGQAATMQPGDVWLMAGVALAGVAATACLLKEFGLVCFDDGFARVTGWPVSVIDLLMMAMVVLVTVAGIRAVGLIMVVALLIIPPVAARFWTDRLWLLAVIAGGVGAASGYGGSVASAMLPRLPAGAVIVLAAGGVFVISMLAAPTHGVVAASIRRIGLRLRVASDHVLEAAFEGERADIAYGEIASLGRLRGWSPVFRRLLMARLRLGGLLERGTGRAVRVTQAGLDRGARVSRNHALWEQYLVSYADVAPSHVDWSVDQVEHVLSEELVSRLEARLRARGIETAVQPHATGAVP